MPYDLNIQTDVRGDDLHPSERGDNHRLSRTSEAHGMFWTNERIVFGNRVRGSTTGIFDTNTGLMSLTNVQRLMDRAFEGLTGHRDVAQSSATPHTSHPSVLFELERLFVRPVSQIDLISVIDSATSMPLECEIVATLREKLARIRAEYGESVIRSQMNKPVVEADYQEVKPMRLPAETMMGRYGAHLYRELQGTFGKKQPPMLYFPPT